MYIFIVNIPNYKFINLESIPIQSREFSNKNKIQDKNYDIDFTKKKKIQIYMKVILKYVKIIFIFLYNGSLKLS